MYKLYLKAEINNQELQLVISTFTRQNDCIIFIAGFILHLRNDLSIKENVKIFTR